VFLLGKLALLWKNHSWKQTATNLGHAKCRKKVVRKMGRLGKVYVPVGEACSNAVVLCTLLASTILKLVQDAKLLVFVMNPVDQLRKELWYLVGYCL
jgi:hypothetical protein